MYTPVNPSFTILKWGVRGYKVHGHVILMARTLLTKEFVKFLLIFITVTAFVVLLFSKEFFKTLSGTNMLSIW